MTTPTLPPPGRAREMALKAQRKADALRTNLRRRKEQTRARSAADDASPLTDVGTDRTHATEAD